MTKRLLMVGHLAIYVLVSPSKWLSLCAPSLRLHVLILLQIHADPYKTLCLYTQILTTGIAFFLPLVVSNIEMFSTLSLCCCSNFLSQ